MVYNQNVDKMMLQIKHIMLDSGLRQVDIVEKTGLQKSTVSNLLNGRSKNITLDTLLLLCNAIGYDIEINLIKHWHFQI